MLTNWKHTVSRFQAMDWDEIRTRLLQELSKRSDALIFGLRIGSVSGELRGPKTSRQSTSIQSPNSPLPFPARLPGRFFFTRSSLDDIEALLRSRFPDETARIIAQAERICRHEFDLLGYSGLPYGPAIDWRWDPVNDKRAPQKLWYKIPYLDFDAAGDHKIVWELNRHQHLVTLAKAYRLTREGKFVNELLSEWQDWQRKNCYPRGINWASSLEVAFRSLAWLWVGHLLAPNSIVPASFQNELLRSLALNARHIERYLSTYSSPNTHLLGEAVALFFIGTLCPQLSSAARWQATGWQIILEQAERQVRADGWHFEQSTYYHVYALDFFLHARILAARNEISIPPAFDRTIERMLEALRACSQAGVPPRSGDDDGGRVFDPRRNRCEHMLDPLSTGAILYGRPDFKAASGGLKEESLWLLGPEGIREFDKIKSTATPVSTRLESSGIYVMTNCVQTEHESSIAPPLRQLVIDAGPQGTGNSGHGHADALSVQLSVSGEQWLIDPGTFRYISPGGERDFYRGTEAHNTLRVDGRSQADPVHPFAWDELPLVQTDQWIVGRRFDLFAGHHDGYCRLAQPVTHRRWVFHLKSHFWLVRDLAEGEGEHDLELFWRFAPPLVPSYTPPGFTLARAAATGTDSRTDRRTRGLRLLPVEGHGWSQEIRRGRTSPAYGVEEAAPVICFAAKQKLVPAEFAILLQPLDDMPAGEVSFKRTGAGESTGVQGYRYTASEAHHLIFFSDRGGDWETGSWKSDARFIYAGLCGRDETVHLALCGGSYLDHGAKRLLECDRSVAWCEMMFHHGGLEISCSDPGAVAEGDSANLDSLWEALLKNWLLSC
ncbi:MAG: alginate lyase family protein [Terriglobia bacterium]